MPAWAARRRQRRRQPVTASPAGHSPLPAPLATPTGDAMPSPKIPRSQPALAAALLLGLAALAALPSPRPSSAGPRAPQGPGPLSGWALGQVLEGDGPSPESLPPGALPAAPAIAARIDRFWRERGQA